MKNIQKNYQDFLHQILWDVTDWEKDSIKFKKKIADAPLSGLDYEIAWLSDDAVIASVMLREVTLFQQVLDKLQAKHTEGTAEAFNEIFHSTVEIIRDSIRSLHRTLSFVSVMNSIGMFHNAVGFYTYKAKWELVRKFEYYLEILNWESK